MPASIVRVRARSLAALVVAGAFLALPSAAFASFGDRPLHVGSHGHDVRVLQSWLTHIGVATKVDGTFGRRTGRSVRRFERTRGRVVDGRLSRADARLLRTLIEGDAADAAPSVPRGAPVATATATIADDGRTAVAPAGAPRAVAAVIAAANRITDKPYVWGGGHRRWEDRGYDCSGAVSYALHGAGLLDEPLVSGAFARWGDKGPGAWITVYGHGGHAYMVVAGLRFDTSGDGERGPRWRTESRSGRGYAQRHPPGL